MRLPAERAHATITTPIGDLLAVAERGALTALTWVDATTSTPAGSVEAQEEFDDLALALADYFEGRSVDFDIPLSPTGTAFQRRVWKELTRIPRGSTTTYAQLARRIGRPAAVRAVGSANGANRIAILVPCHRVIGSDGRLRGYAGGVSRKLSLLEIEGVNGLRDALEHRAVAPHP